MSQRKTPWNALSLSEDRHSNCAICGSLTIFDLEITGRKAQICSSCSARITVLITLKSGRQTISWDNLTTCWGLYSFPQKLGTSNLSHHWFPHVNPTSQFDGMGIVSNSMNVPCQYEMVNSHSSSFLPVACDAGQIIADLFTLVFSHHMYLVCNIKDTNQSRSISLVPHPKSTCKKNGCNSVKRTRLPADSAKVSLSMAGQVEHLLNGTCGTWSCLEKACPHVVYIYIVMFIGKLLSLWYWMGINGHQWASMGINGHQWASTCGQNLPKQTKQLRTT